MEHGLTRKLLHIPTNQSAQGNGMTKLKSNNFFRALSRNIGGIF